METSRQAETKKLCGLSWHRGNFPVWICDLGGAEVPGNSPLVELQSSCVTLSVVPTVGGGCTCVCICTRACMCILRRQPLCSLGVLRGQLWLCCFGVGNALVEVCLGLVPQGATEDFQHRWFVGSVDKACLLMQPGEHGWLSSMPYFFATAPNPWDKGVPVAVMRHSEVEKLG